MGFRICELHLSNFSWLGRLGFRVSGLGFRVGLGKSWFSLSALEFWLTARDSAEGPKV